MFKTVRRVEFRDTDAAGIMHFSTFFNKMEEAEHELLRSLGTSVIVYGEDQTVSWPRVSVSCDFSRPVKFEDLLDIEVTLARLGRTSATFLFRFYCQGEPVAMGKITTVHCRVHGEGPPTSLPIPEPLRAKLAEHLEPSETAS